MSLSLMDIWDLGNFIEQRYSIYVFIPTLFLYEYIPDKQEYSAHQMNEYIDEISKALFLTPQLL